MNTARDLQRFSYAFNLSVLRTRMFKQYFVNNCRQKSSKKFERTEKDFTNLIQPRSVNPRLYNHDMDVGSELSGKLKKGKTYTCTSFTWLILLLRHFIELECNVSFDQSFFYEKEIVDY